VRDCYSETFTWNDPSLGQALKPLNGALVTVYLAGTLTKATIYAARDPANSTQVQNPFTTTTAGLAEFWAVAGEYDITVADQGGLARVSTKTFGWNSSPAAVGSLPSATIKGDAALAQAALSADVVKQQHAIGEVISWWRPSAAVPLPAGFVVCDGQVVAAGAHDFTGFSGAFNTPDMRNKFILGASATATYGSSSAAADAAASAPGINGTGGNNVKSISHTHTHAHTHDLSNHTHANDHTHTHDHIHNVAHTHSLSGHTHGMGNHTHYADHTHQFEHQHDFTTPDHLHGSGSLQTGGSSAGDTSVQYLNGGPLNLARGGHIHGVGGTTGAADRGLGGRTTSPIINGGYNYTTGSMNGRTTTDGPSTNTTAGPSTDATGAASITNSGTPIGSGGGAALATSGPSSVNTAAPSNNTSGGASNATTDPGGSTTFDFRPQYVGLLFLMKVKRITAY
jgi:hypothetical protein